MKYGEPLEAVMAGTANFHSIIIMITLKGLGILIMTMLAFLASLIAVMRRNLQALPSLTFRL